jgi:hypothetical protein
MAVRQGTLDPQRLAGPGKGHAALEQGAQALDHRHRQLREIAESALLDLAVLAIALAQQHGGRRFPIGYDLDEHSDRESALIHDVKPKLHGHKYTAKTPFSS